MPYDILVNESFANLFSVEALKQNKADEGLFSESSEEEFLNDSPKLQRTNAKRFGKVSFNIN